MRNGGDTAERVATVLRHLLGEGLPLAVRAWDGSELASPDGDASAPVLVVHSRRAVRRLLWDPDEIGAARAYVAEEIDIEGDLIDALRRVRILGRDLGHRSRLQPTARADVARNAVLLGAVGPSPRPPAEEIVLSGEPHTALRDRVAARARDDLGVDFSRAVLGPSLVASTARWAGADTLEQAQRAKLDEVCRALDLQPGQRLLDLGCGFGALLVHAVAHYDVTAVGVTLSERQAAGARERASGAGLGGRVEVRVQDYRDVDDGPYDAIASLGVVEHVGRQRLRDYADVVYALLRPGGLLFQEQTLARPGPTRAGRSFAQAYVSPDTEPPLLGELIGDMDAAGLGVSRVLNLRGDDIRTLRSWSQNLEHAWAAAVAGIGVGRARAWRLFLSASIVAAETGGRDRGEILAQRPSPRSAPYLAPTTPAPLGAT